MATTVDQLILEIRAETRQLRKGLDSVNKKLDKTKKTTKGANSAFKKMKAALIAIGATQVLGKVVQINRTFEDLEATLRAVTGSVEAAAKSFELIRAFTSTTTFQIEEVAQSFITLKQAGIIPTSDALMDFGNFAAGMGKSITQLAQAAFNATTGEMEMLKQFGVIARQQGDKVTVTFDGTTKTIERSGDAIVDYLRSIGREKFPTAIEERFNTLSGAISNLNDQVSEFAVSIGDGVGATGLRQGFIDLAKATGSLIETLRPLGQVIGFIIGAIADLIAVILTAIDNILVVGRAILDITNYFEILSGVLDGSINSFETFKIAVRGGTSDLEELDKTLLELLATGGDFRLLFNTAEEKDYKLFIELRKQVEKTRSGVKDLIDKDFARLRAIVSKTVEAQLTMDVTASLTKVGELQDKLDALTSSGKTGSEEFKKTLDELSQQNIGRFVGSGENKFFQLNEAEVAERKKQFTRALLGVDSIEEFAAEITENTDLLEAPLKEVSDTFATTLAPAIQSASLAFTTDFVDALLSGENALDSFKDFSKTIVSQIISTFLQLAVVNEILNSVFGLQGSNRFSTLRNLNPTDTNAGGGTVQGGRASLVGERGPEIFVPNTGGTIMNNMNSKNAMGGGGTTVINQSINFATGVVPTVRAEVMKMMPQIAEVTKGAVAEAAVRGGNYRRMLQGG